MVSESEGAVAEVEPSHRRPSQLESNSAVGDKNSLEALQVAKQPDEDRQEAGSNELEVGNKELDRLDEDKGRVLEVRFIFLGSELF